MRCERQRSSTGSPLLDAGRHTEVVGALREAVTDEPWREARQMQLALALYRSGRQAEALRAIQRYKSELADEIGLVPSANLDELEHKILDHDPILLAPLAPPARASAATSSTR